MNKLAVAALLLVGVSTSALAQGVPVVDSGLTARDIIETADREADLAVQGDTLAVEEAISEIEREQLSVLDAILDAQTSFDAGGVALSGMVSGLEDGIGDADRSVEARARQTNAWCWVTGALS